MIRWYSAADIMDEGAAAFLEGRPISDCPYAMFGRGDAQSLAKAAWWAKGWRQQERWATDPSSNNLTPVAPER